MRFVRLLWITTIPGRAWVGSVSNKHNPSTESGLGACISSRITTVIHVRNDHQINCNCFNEPFAVSPYESLYWDMHGLIFETSIWLLAGSTRLIHHRSHLKDVVVIADLVKEEDNNNTLSSSTVVHTLSHNDYRIQISSKPTRNVSRYPHTCHWGSTYCHNPQFRAWSKSS